MSNQSILREKIKCIEVEEKSISNLIMEMGNTAFQGRTLSRAVDVWEEMLKADNLTIALGFSGSMCTAGQWKMICWLVEKRFIDVLISTGANLSEDIVDAMGYGYWQGDPQVSDKELLQQDVNRYYDIYGRESDYRKMEELITEFILTLESGFKYSSMEFLHLFGKWLGSMGIKSIAAVAAENKVPIFCPAITDSAFGEAFLMAKNDGQIVSIDQVKEFDQFVGIGEKTGDIGVVYIGGGVPKDFSQLLAISLSPKTMDEKVAGREGFLRKSVKEYYYPHRYAIQITTDSPQWGGLSGCTLEEAISWGKVSSEGKRVTCYCDATIALPLITHALNERVNSRRQVQNMNWLFHEVT